MTFTTRTAPRNARMIKPSADQLAGIDDMIARAAVFGRRPNMSASSAEGSSSQPAPTSDVPNTAPDTGARLDAMDGQLADHEARITALEERSPAPGLNDGTANAPAESSAVTAAASPLMVNAHAIYGRLSARSVGPEAAAIPPMPAMIQTGNGPRLDAGAINARHNALAAARAGRPHARARG